MFVHDCATLNREKCAYINQISENIKRKQAHDCCYSENVQTTHSRRRRRIEFIIKNFVDHSSFHQESVIALDSRPRSKTAEYCIYVHRMAEKNEIEKENKFQSCTFEVEYAQWKKKKQHSSMKQKNWISVSVCECVNLLCWYCLASWCLCWLCECALVFMAGYSKQSLFFRLHHVCAMPTVHLCELVFIRAFSFFVGHSHILKKESTRWRNMTPPIIHSHAHKFTIHLYFFWWPTLLMYFGTEVVLDIDYFALSNFSRSNQIKYWVLKCKYFNARGWKDEIRCAHMFVHSIQEGFD